MQSRKIKVKKEKTVDLEGKKWYNISVYKKLSD